MGISGCCNKNATIERGDKNDSNIIKNTNTNLLNELTSKNNNNEINDNINKEKDDKDGNVNQNKEQINEKDEGSNPNKINGYNTEQKINEIKAYRFFIDNLCTLIMVNNNLEVREFYFVRKNWIKSWYNYTCYQNIKPLLVKNEINNELDFQKIIIDHKKELDFQGFTEKEKPDPIQFFEINKMNTNINENFYIIDEKIYQIFVENYGIDENNGKEEDFKLIGEIGKGRIVFDVNEYILIMVVDRIWVIKQLMIIFNTKNEHERFLKKIYGRAITFISKELKKEAQKQKMIIYKKDEIYVYDARDFIKYGYFNHSLDFKCSTTSDNNFVKAKKNKKFSNKNRTELAKNGHEMILKVGFLSKQHKKINN